MSILASLRNRRTAPDARPEPEAADQRSAPVMRFLALGGAEVIITALPPRSRDLSHRWTCLGCDAFGEFSSLRWTRDDANKHASECRAMPKPEAATR